MPRTAIIFAETWEQHNGKCVKISGRAYRLQVTQYTAKYPVVCEMVDVQAVPTNKRAKWYLDEKANLGDDFTVDVLDSDIELQAEILSQLA